jgi:DNA-binding NtrC family response regulator
MESSSSSSSVLPSGREVLVVEDEVRIRDMLSRALKEMGFHATLAPSAEAATRLMAQRNFDILMLDLNLPAMGGMEFFETVRKKHRDIQVIILTGFGDLEAAKQAIHLDVVEFLTKPCALGKLEIALDRARKRCRGQIVSESAAASEPLLQFDSPDERKPAITLAGVAQAADGDETLSLEELEQRHILTSLQKHNGKRAAVAAELGISIRKLFYRLGEYQKKGLIP